MWMNATLLGRLVVRIGRLGIGGGYPMWMNATLLGRLVVHIGRLGIGGMDPTVLGPIKYEFGTLPPE